jgi:hypothetical protein
MYLDNKYTIAYNNIISRAKARVLVGYGENHHIIPKSLGGSDDKNNLVKLTAREHFICHLLLTKMVTGKAKRSMTFAVWSLTNLDHSKMRERHKVTSHRYEILKKECAKASSELHKGKTVSDETKKKQSDYRKGKPSTFKGKTHSEASKNLLAEHRSKPCISPSGERFSSTKEAGLAYDMTGVGIRGHIHRGKSGWRYERDEDQAVVVSNRKPKKEKIYKPQSDEHIQKRIQARAISGHYKDREATIERMSIAAKLKNSK